MKRSKKHGRQQLNNYTICDELGKGSFGAVYKVRHSLTEQYYAMKTLQRQTKFSNLRASDEIKAEINIMKDLKHENIVTLYEVIDDPSSKEVYLIQELMDNGPILPNSVVCDPLPLDIARYKVSKNCLFILIIFL